MKIMKHICALLAVLTLLFAMTVPTFAAETPDIEGETALTVNVDESSATGDKAIAAAICIGMAAAAGAIGMAMAISKSAESMARQPEAYSKVNTAMMLGLVFIETAIIYALIVAILIIFVL